MKKSIVFLNLFTLAFAQVYTSPGGKCGYYNNGLSCPSGQCCSRSGFCGVTAAHCSGGCQPAYGHCTFGAPSPSGRCGPVNGLSCPDGLCCSKNGYCGSSDDYCTNGCQNGYGTCRDQRCGLGFGTQCPEGQCCSQNGYCGVSEPYCGKGCQYSYGACTLGTFLPTVYDKCIKPNTIAVAFDDGPYTSDLVDLFDYAGHRATFFVDGCAFENADAIVKADLSGHQIATQAWANFSQQAFVSELDRLESQLVKVLGKVPTYFHPADQVYDSASLIVLGNHGYRSVIETSDSSVIWDDTKIVYRRADYGTVNTFIPWLFDWADKNGKEIVTVADCLDSPVQDWYRWVSTPETENSSWVC